VSTISTIKKIVASTAIAGALSVAGLGMAGGIASAAPGDHSESGSGASTKSEHQAHTALKTATNGENSEKVHAHSIPGFTPKPAAGAEDPVIPAHLIPGFTPKPAPTTTSNNGLGSTLDPGQVCERGQSCPVQHG
jgi:hypothetical protein